jgi:hypothetical protein
MAKVTASTAIRFDIHNVTFDMIVLRFDVHNLTFARTVFKLMTPLAKVTL